MDDDIKNVEVYYKCKNKIHFEKQKFEHVLKEFDILIRSKLNSSYTKPFQKVYISKFHDELIYQYVYDKCPPNIDNLPIASKENVYIVKHIYPQNESVFKQISNKLKTKTIHISYFVKESQPIYAFPSTQNINEITFDKRITFKINNRLYVNFCITEHMSEKNKNNQYYYIFMNYNHSPKTDIVKNIELIIEISSHLIDIINNKC